MTNGFYDQVTEELKLLGFSRISGGKGSHEKWKKEGGPVITVPRKLKSRHTANGILKDAGSSMKI